MNQYRHRCIENMGMHELVRERDGVSAQLGMARSAIEYYCDELARIDEMLEQRWGYTTPSDTENVSNE